jgi:hypothetical protein
MLNQGVVSIIVAIIAIVGTLIATGVGNFLGRRTERKNEIRKSLEELFTLLDQINIWVQVNLRYLYREVQQIDYHRPNIPPEYVEDYIKLPDCPLERLEMLISFDAPSLMKYLPEYTFIVFELRKVRYIYETHKTISTLNYYFRGIFSNEYEKMGRKEVNTKEEFLQYVTSKFPELHNHLRTDLSKLAQKN